MKIEWEIKSIKRWENGTWDALLSSTQDGRKVFDRVLSTDGFHWRNKNRQKPVDSIQDDLSRAAGDMEEHGIRVVVF